MFVGDRTITGEGNINPGPPIGEKGENIPFLPWTSVSSDGLSPLFPESLCPPPGPPRRSNAIASNPLPSRFSPLRPTFARSRNSSENLLSYSPINVS